MQLDAPQPSHPTLYPASAMGAMLLRQCRPDAPKPCTSSTGGPQPAVAYFTRCPRHSQECWVHAGAPVCTAAPLPASLLLAAAAAVERRRGWLPACRRRAAGLQTLLRAACLRLEAVQGRALVAAATTTAIVAACLFPTPGCPLASCDLDRTVAVFREWNAWLRDISAACLLRWAPPCRPCLPLASDVTVREAAPVRAQCSF